MLRVLSLCPILPLNFFSIFKIPLTFIFFHSFISFSLLKNVIDGQTYVKMSAKTLVKHFIMLEFLVLL